MISVLYASVVYVFFLATFVYAILFVGDIAFIPTSVDRGISSDPLTAVGINVVLFAIFGMQHSVMARRGFKAWANRFVPPHIERSNFVLASTLALALLLWQWRPIANITIWEATSMPVRVMLNIIFWSGWGVLLLSTFLLDHFDLFGLRQTWSHFRGHQALAPQFRTPLFYRYVRHPLYLGFMLAFWATPYMTAGHLLFAIGTTGYIFVGIWFEERDLLVQFGERYRLYAANVGMVFPRLPRGSRNSIR